MKNIIKGTYNKSKKFHKEQSNRKKTLKNIYKWHIYTFGHLHR